MHSNVGPCKRNMDGCSVYLCLNKRLRNSQLNVDQQQLQQKWTHCEINHMFPNAGEIAYIIGKCWVAPLRQQSLPRPKVQAVMYGTKVKQFILDKNDIEIDGSFFWTYSTTVLHWLYESDEKQRLIEVNRIAEIRDGFNHWSEETFRNFMAELHNQPTLEPEESLFRK